MSLPDALASAALDAPVIRPVWLAMLDIRGDMVRANSSGADIAIASPDPELAGTFLGVDHRFVEVSTVKAASGGIDTVTARLSGIPGLDDDTLDQLADPANWRGRPARLWRIIFDASGNQQGAVQPYYTGYMTSLMHGGTGAGEPQTIAVTIESYLATLTAASNRSYLDQERYDPGDLSARAAIAIANGNTGGALVGGGGRGGMTGGGGRPGSLLGGGNTHAY